MKLSLFIGALALAALTLMFGPVAPLVAVVAFLLYGIARMATRAPRRPWMHAGLPALLIALIVLPALALAADSGAAPETVAQATSDTTKVTWAYGAVIQQWATALGSLVFAVVMFALRQLPAQVYAVIVSMRADQLLQKGIDYGINAVQGATKDKTLSVDVGNKVLAHAVQYVLDNAPSWLQAWMGGPDQIVKKIFARLNLDSSSTAPSTSAVLAQSTNPAS